MTGRTGKDKREEKKAKDGKAGIKEWEGEIGRKRS